MMADWKRRTVLVTGAGGFIGSHLVERLVGLGAKTRALVEYNSDGSWGWLDRSPVRSEVDVTLGDVRERDGLGGLLEGVDVVFHLAALIAVPYSYRSPASFVRTNVEGTLNVLQAARDAGVGLFVQTSSSEVYGTAQYVPIDEAHPLQGQSPYAASKIGADKMAEAFHRSFGLPVATLRPFNTYGPRQSGRAIIPTIISQALDGHEIRLGNLEPTRDFTFVDDTVAGFTGIADCPGAVGRTVNIGTGREVSIRDLVSAVVGLLGKEVQVQLDEQRVRPEDSEVYRLCADVTLASELMGWSAGHSLEEGLVKTIKWTRENLGRHEASAYAV